MNALRYSTRVFLPALLAGAMGTGCEGPVDNPSAYELERDLCAPEYAAEWDDEVAACREAYDDDESCGGVISFSGELQSQPFTVDTRITHTLFEDVSMPDGSVLRDVMDLVGQSPYFVFGFNYRDIGGDLQGEGDGRALQFSRAFDDGAERLLDDRTSIKFRMTVGAESISLHPLGELHITQQTASEQVGSFVARLGEEEFRGCFHALASTRVVNREQ